MRKIRFFALSTCGACRGVQRLLEKCGAEFDHFVMDLLEGDAREAALEELKKYNPKASYPTVVVGEEAVVGRSEDPIRRLIGCG